MKRLKEIKNQAYILSESVKRCNKDLGDVYEASFIEGAKWADKNPKDGMVSIDKACEWLKNTIDDDVFINCGSVIKFMPANEFVEYFRETMEE